MDEDMRIYMKTKNSIETCGVISEFATLIAGLSLLIPACVGLLISRFPTPLGPFPGITAIPAFFLSSRTVAVAIPSFLFFAWNPRLFRGEMTIPRRSHWLLAIATLLSVIWFVMGWKFGLQYQGTRYVYEVSAANVFGIAFLATGFSWSRKWEGSFTLNLALHWLLFVWLAWYAFPYLGELP
jgi:hypothetical protein